MTTVLEKVVCVQAYDTGLVGLCHVGEYHVDHGHEHAVLVGVSRVLDDGDDVGTLLGHVNQVTTGAVRELHGVHATLRTDDIRDVRHGRAR